MIKDSKIIKDYRRLTEIVANKFHEGNTEAVNNVLKDFDIFIEELPEGQTEGESIAEVADFMKEENLPNFILGILCGLSGGGCLLQTKKIDELMASEEIKLFIESRAKNV